MSDQIADVLDDAADLLEREGWIQGAGHGPVGRCAMVAIGRAALADVHSYEVARDVFAEAVGAGITDWNDAPERNKQQVLDAFRAAAKAERMAAS